MSKSGLMSMVLAVCGVGAWAWGAGAPGSATRPSDAAQLPEMWQGAMIGAAADSGQWRCDASVGSLTLVSGPGDFSGTADCGMFVYKAVRGDFEMIGRLGESVTGVEGGPAPGRAGLMVRESLDPKARSASVWRDGKVNVTTAREEKGADAQPWMRGNSGGDWYRIVRWRDTLVLYTSQDPQDWGRAQRSLVLKNLASELLVGVVAAAAGKSPEPRPVAMFSDVRLQPFAPGYVTSWLGNSFSGAHHRAHVPMHVNGFAVHEASGVSAVLAVWDEGGPNLGIFDSHGQMLNDMTALRPVEAASGYGVAIDEQYVYSSAVVAKKQRGIKRFSHTGVEKPWPGGSAFVETPSSASPRGVAVDTVREELHVALEGDKKILVYDRRDPARGPKREWTLADGPRYIAVDRDGNLWVTLRRNDAEQYVARFGPTGTLQKTIRGLGFPMGLFVRGNGDLLVCDSGREAQNVKIYSAAQIAGSGETIDRPSSTFGAAGGVYGGVPGEIAAGKLVGPVGVGVDAKGRAYVAGNLIHRRADFSSTPRLTARLAGNGMSSGTQIYCYASLALDAAIEWSRFGLEGMSAGDFLPGSDGKVIFTREHKYTMDYSRPAGQEWKLAALTHDPDTYPHDLRIVDNTGYLPGGVQVRVAGGHRLMFVRDQRYYAIMIYRFRAGSEIAVPAAALVAWTSAENKWPPGRPPSIGDKHFLWTDRNGDGQMDGDEYAPLGVKLDYARFHVDVDGAIWAFSNRMNRIYRWRLGSVDAGGVPSYAAAEDFAVPPEFNSVGSLWHDPVTKQLYVIGYSKCVPNVRENTAMTFGTELACYDNWPAAPRLAWQREVAFKPHTGGHERVASEITGVTRDFVVTQRKDIAGFTFYRRPDGSQYKSLVPGPEVGMRVGLIDIPWAASVMQRSDGEILLTCEENEDAKILLYRVRP